MKLPSNKKCGWCDIEKPLSEFHVRKKNGRETPRNECKGCYRGRRNKKYHLTKEDTKEKRYLYSRREGVLEKRRLYGKNRELLLQQELRLKRRERYKENSEKIKEKRKKYYIKNKEKVIELNNKYLLNNKSRLRAAQRINHSRRKKEDISYSILKVLRTRVSAAVKNKGIKCQKTVHLVGCTMPELLVHLEQRFMDGMSWRNYGYYGWHIDHIKPCKNFDLSKPDEQKKCFHFTNLQPLWWIDNIKKGARLDYVVEN